MTTLGLQCTFEYALTPGTQMPSPHTSLSAYLKNTVALHVRAIEAHPGRDVRVGQRPRIQRTNSWGRSTFDPYVKLDRRYITATPPEIVAHVQDAFNFVLANPVPCEHGTALAYAWNEFDEGGRLASTRDGSGQARQAALAAIL